LERLRQVVVGAEGQAADALRRGAGGGEHQHHRRVLALGEHAADRIAMQTREVAVQHDDVIAVQVELRCRLQPVVGDVNGHPFVVKAIGQRLCERARVLDHEHPHGGASAASADRHPQAAAVAGAELQRAAVRLDDRGDDREPRGRRRCRTRSARRPARRNGRVSAATSPRVERRSAVLDDEPRAPAPRPRW